ncbi:hypothetical protein GCM10010329_81000 [Streptomyces spiroverticillatus]|uniref:Uncharacterized protein n=1 Tax=Streptomyces finlayi TaxID=67296 RepID=A0A919CFQ5_9ACTN|nr:hypothetical protein [Streptomyces finlayi]GHA46237.1 hypothetical protein GCM10010329_81000 [Streptomyces spiroverticillatus]GHD16411.1 hypothetical protein GCM10010334_77490 [Streptomyces finlayi]
MAENLTTTEKGVGGGLVVARRLVQSARDRGSCLSESDGGGTGKSDGND